MDQNNEPPKIVFEGEEFQQTSRSFQASTPKMVEWVIKYSGGYIKDEKQASYALLGFVVVVITISLFLVFGGGGVKKGPKLPPSLPTPISLYEK